MRISDLSSDVCSSDLVVDVVGGSGLVQPRAARPGHRHHENADRSLAAQHGGNATDTGSYAGGDAGFGGLAIVQQRQHTSHPWAMDAHVHEDRKSTRLNSSR